MEGDLSHFRMPHALRAARVPTIRSSRGNNLHFQGVGPGSVHLLRYRPNGEHKVRELRVRILRTEDRNETIEGQS